MDLTEIFIRGGPSLLPKGQDRPKLKVRGNHFSQIEHLAVSRPPSSGGCFATKELAMHFHHGPLHFPHLGFHPWAADAHDKITTHGTDAALQDAPAQPRETKPQDPRRAFGIDADPSADGDDSDLTGVEGSMIELP
jgi:hypothetical protein